MEQRSGQTDAGPNAARLLGLALQLREAAAETGQHDVVAKADEAITLITGAGNPADRRPDRDGKGNTVVQMLDGLGL